jgi:hypothetical protein
VIWFIFFLALWFYFLSAIIFVGLCFDLVLISSLLCFMYLCVPFANVQGLSKSPHMGYLLCFCFSGISFVGFPCFTLFLPQDTSLSSLRKDPFFELQENHNLIGVANVYLSALFYDVKLDYQVPIVSQQGEVGGLAL